MLLPIDRYTPGASLPPHLSPFVDDEQEGYVPDYRKELNKMKNPNNDDRILEEEQIQENSKQKVNDANLETIKHVGKGAKRRLGNGLQVDESQVDETDREEIQEGNEDIQGKELAKMLMSNRKKKIFDRLQNDINKKKEVAENLESKRRSLRSNKNKISGH